MVLDRYKCVGWHIVFLDTTVSDLKALIFFSEPCEKSVPKMFMYSMVDSLYTIHCIL